MTSRDVSSGDVTPPGVTPPGDVTPGDVGPGDVGPRDVIRVVIVDDQPVVRVGVARILGPGDGEGPPVLVLTTFDDDDVLWGALDAGAAGFVLKDTSAEDLIAAARAVARGAAWLDPKVAPRVLEEFRANVRPRLAQAGRVAELTEREHDVLRNMARGATNGEIAAALAVSEATVKTHVGAIFAKLGVRDRAAAIIFAYDHGIVGPRPGVEAT